MGSPLSSPNQRPQVKIEFDRMLRSNLHPPTLPRDPAYAAALHSLTHGLAQEFRRALFASVPVLSLAETSDGETWTATDDATPDEGLSLGDFVQVRQELERLLPPAPAAEVWLSDDVPRWVKGGRPGMYLLPATGAGVLYRHCWAYSSETVEMIFLMHPETYEQYARPQFRLWRWELPVFGSAGRPYQPEQSEEDT